MDSNSWINCPSVFSSSSSSRRYQSRSDLYLGGGFEDFEGEDDLKAEFICPFCSEDFDFVGLCCHIDEEHPVEAKNGVCPVCTKRVGMDIVGHVTTQHRNFFKVQRRRRLRRGGYSSAYLALKKELREANMQSLLGGSSNFNSSAANIDSDPLLSSFMFNTPSAKESGIGSVTSITEGASATKASPHEQSLERDIRETPLSGEDQEKARKSEFVRGLLLSTMFEDI
ncbi:PREDICTED: protein DEHYDRATION-INDUCED 19 homolog 4-like [Tarenaya hassleriana]|uniref:protein DEHYDRATION-INDUCED 19 homolog 4-like n=1 Tax=Tarenaya hassleriana TaxID=28532 RepID=UPI00053C8C7F|nr:PREDICTED: protein DEHYDRATION-INDUCED 19 homolog 4-like [Tarenaya hassleriana]